MRVLFLGSVFVVSTCGLVYELISGTLASYLLGDSVTQFSTVIGVYLFSMGIGSYLSKHVHHNLIKLFVRVEILIGLVGGVSSALLFLSFEHISSFRTLLYGLIGILGTLVGLEIPLMMRILQEYFEFKDLVSKIFTFDYVGALIASLLFPLLLVPHLGLIRSALFFGILNVLVALATIFLFAKTQHWARLMRGTALFVLGILIAGFIFSDQILSFSEASIFPDRVVYAKSSAYQRIILTSKPSGASKAGDFRLFLNNNLQFSSRDEYRYHEALVHVGMSASPQHAKILVLGGGDGMAVRELLRYPDVESISLVDLDGEITKLFKTHPDLVELNQGAFLNPKVKVMNVDAFQWIREPIREPLDQSEQSEQLEPTKSTARGAKDLYDFIVVDFPDPSNFSLGKLFSTAFYHQLIQRLRDQGVAVIQSTSPWVARKSYWCIEATLRAVGFQTLPYHVYVPAFGEWGFVLASKAPIQQPSHFLAGLKFLNSETAPALFQFPPDMSKVSTEINRLNNQALVRYFDEEWADYAH